MINKILIYIMFFGFVGLSFSNVDSLLKITESKQADTTKIKALFEIREIYTKENSTEIPKILDKIIKLAEKNRIYYFKAKALNFMGSYHIYNRNNDLAIDFYKKSLKISTQYKIGETAYISYLNLSIASRRKNEIKKELEYLYKALNICSELNYPKGESQAARQLASYYMRNEKEDSTLKYYDLAKVFLAKTFGKTKDSLNAELFNELARYQAGKSNYDSAFYYFEKAGELRKKLDNQSNYADILSNIAYLRYIQSKFDDFVKYNLMALKVNEKLNNKEAMANIYSDISVVQKDKLNQYPQAIKNLNLAIDLNTKLNNITGLIANYINYSDCYNLMDSLNLALTFNEKALTLAKQIKDESSQAIIYQNRGILYKKLNKLRESEADYLKAIDLNLKLNNQQKLAQCYTNLADLYKDTKRFYDANLYLIKAQKISESLGDAKTTLVIYDNLAQLNDTMQNWVYAYYYLSLHSKLKDSLNNALQNKAIAELNTQYETEKKEKEITNLILQKNLKEESDKIKNWAFLIGILMLSTLIFVFYNRYRLKKKSNLLLEKQKSQITHQKKLVDEKNEEIMSSIRYAKQIQNAMMPDQTQISQSLLDYFLIFKPKDIVSGDFYWFADFHGTIFIAVVDCTGHGIPGAMLSLVGNMILNESIASAGLMETDLILEYMNDKVITFFKQESMETDSQDGMDLSLIKIDRNRNKLHFTGAKRPLYIMDKDGNLTYLKGNMRSIGGRQRRTGNFDINTIDLKENTNIYLFSDGITDQMGANGKKYGTKNLKEFIEKNYNYKMSEQGRLLEFELANFMGKTTQRDDITIFGVKL